MVKDSSLAVSADLAACSIARFFGFGGAGDAAVKRREGACGGRSAGSLSGAEMTLQGACGGRSFSFLAVMFFLVGALAGGAWAVTVDVSQLAYNSGTNAATEVACPGFANTTSGCTYQSNQASAATPGVGTGNRQDVIVNINNPADLTLTGISNIVRVRVKKSSTLNIENLSLQPDGDITPPIAIDDSSVILTLVLHGSNTLTGSNGGSPGIWVPTSSTLIIKEGPNGGSLNVKGGGNGGEDWNQGGGAAIGGRGGFSDARGNSVYLTTAVNNVGGDCGTVYINGGTIIAIGGGGTVSRGGGAGIGGGGGFGRATTSGTNTAPTNAGGQGCNLYINGGVVTATATHSGNYIGGGTNNQSTTANITYNASANKVIQINGGSVNVEKANIFNNGKNITSRRTAPIPVPTTLTKYNLKLGNSYSPPNTAISGCVLSGLTCDATIDNNTAVANTNNKYGMNGVKTDNAGKVYFWLPAVPGGSSTTGYLQAVVGGLTKYSTQSGNSPNFTYAGEGATFSTAHTFHSDIIEFNEAKFAVGHPIYIKTGTYVRRDGPEESPHTHTYIVKRYQTTLSGVKQPCAGVDAELTDVVTPNNFTTTTDGYGFGYNAIYIPTKNDFGCELAISIAPAGGVATENIVGRVGSKVTIKPDKEAALTFLRDKDNMAEFVWNEQDAGNKLPSLKIKVSSNPDVYEITRVIYDFGTSGNPKPFTLISSVPSGIKYKFKWFYKLGTAGSEQSIDALPSNPTEEQKAAEYNSSKVYQYDGDGGDLQFRVEVRDGEPPKVLKSTKGYALEGDAIKTRLTDLNPGNIIVTFSKKLLGVSGAVSSGIGLYETSDINKTNSFLNGTCTGADALCSEDDCGTYKGTTVTTITCPHKEFKQNSIYKLTFDGFKDVSLSNNDMDPSLNGVYMATPGKGSLDGPAYYVGTSGVDADYDKVFTINGKTLADPDISVTATYAESNSGALEKIEYLWQIEENIANVSGCLTEEQFNTKYTAAKDKDKDSWDLSAKPGISYPDDNIAGKVRINKVFKPEEFGKYIRIVMRPVGSNKVPSETGTKNGLATCGKWERVGVLMYATDPERLVNEANGEYMNTEILVQGIPLGLASTKGGPDDGGRVIYSIVSITQAGKGGANIINPIHDRITYLWGYTAPVGTTNTRPAANSRNDGISGAYFTPPSTPTGTPPVPTEPSGPIYITAQFGDASPLEVTAVWIGEPNAIGSQNLFSGNVTRVDGKKPIIITFNKPIAQTKIIDGETITDPASNFKTVNLRNGNNSTLLKGTWSNNNQTYTIPAAQLLAAMKLDGSSHSIDIHNFYDVSNNPLPMSIYNFTSYVHSTITLTNDGISPLSVGVPIILKNDDKVKNVTFHENYKDTPIPTEYNYEWQYASTATAPETEWSLRKEGKDSVGGINYNPKASDFLGWIRFVVWAGDAPKAYSDPMQVGVIVKSGAVTIDGKSSAAYISINGRSETESKDGVRIYTADMTTLAVAIQGSYKIADNGKLSWGTNCVADASSMLCSNYDPRQQYTIPEIPGTPPVPSVPSVTVIPLNEAYENGSITLTANLVKADPPVVSSVTLDQLTTTGSTTSTDVNGSALISTKTTIKVKFDQKIKVCGQGDSKSKVVITNITESPSTNVATITPTLGSAAVDEFTLESGYTLNFDKKYNIAVSGFCGFENSVVQVGTHNFNFSTKSTPKITTKPTIVPNETSLLNPAIGHNVNVDFNYVEVDGSESVGNTSKYEYKWFVSDTKDGTFNPTSLVASSDRVLGKELYGKWIKVDVTPKSIYFDTDKDVYVPGPPKTSDAVQVGVRVILAEPTFGEGTVSKKTASAYINNIAKENVIFGSTGTLSVSGQGTDKVTWATTDGGSFSSATGSPVTYTLPTPTGDITIKVEFSDGVIPVAYISSSVFELNGDSSFTLTFNKPVKSVEGNAQIKLNNLIDIPLTNAATATDTYKISVKGLPLNSSTTYHVTLTAGSFVDAAGNTVINGDRAGSFTTLGVNYAVSVSPNTKVFKDAKYNYTEPESDNIIIKNTGSSGANITITNATCTKDDGNTPSEAFECELDDGPATIDKGGTKNVIVTIKSGLGASTTEYSGKLIVTTDKTAELGGNITANLKFSVGKAKIIIATPSVVDTDGYPSELLSTYNGKGRKVKTSYNIGSGDVEVESSVTAPPTVGTTVVPITIDGIPNYEDFSENVTVKINAANIRSIFDIANPENVSLDCETGVTADNCAGIEYKRSAWLPKVVFKSELIPDATMGWVENNDYNISHRDNINATTATTKALAVVTGKGNYTDSIKVPFGIAKATLTVPAIKVNATYGDKYIEIWNNPVNSKEITLKAADDFPVPGLWEFDVPDPNATVSPSGSLTPKPVSAKVTQKPGNDGKTNDNYTFNNIKQFDVSPTGDIVMAKKRLEIVGFGWNQCDEKDEDGNKTGRKVDCNVKVYDGATNTLVGITNVDFSCGSIKEKDRAEGDNDLVLACTPRYTDGKAGSNKRATPNFRLDPPQYDAVYNLESSGLILVGTISKRKTEIVGLTTNGTYAPIPKVYDGKQTASLKNGFTPNNNPTQLTQYISGDNVFVTGTPTPEFTNWNASYYQDTSDTKKFIPKTKDDSTYYFNTVIMRGIELGGTAAENYRLVFDSFRAHIAKAEVNSTGTYFFNGTYGDSLSRINLSTKIRDKNYPDNDVMRIAGIPGETVQGAWGWDTTNFEVKGKTVGKASVCKTYGNCTVPVEFVPRDPNYKATKFNASVIAGPRKLEFTAAGVDRAYIKGDNRVDIRVTIVNKIAEDDYNIEGKGTIYNIAIPGDYSSGIKTVVIDTLILSENIGKDYDNYEIPRPFTSGLKGNPVYVPVNGALKPLTTVTITKADFCKGERGGEFIHEVMVMNGDTRTKVYCRESVPAPYPNPTEIVYDTVQYPNLASITLPSGWSWAAPTKKIGDPGSTFKTVMDDIKYSSLDTNYNSYYGSLAFNVLLRSKNSKLKAEPVIVSPCGADTARVTVVAEDEYATVWFDNNQYFESDRVKYKGTFTKTGLRYGAGNTIDYTIRAQSYDPAYYTHYRIPHTRLITFNRVAAWLRDDKKSATVKLDSTQNVERDFFRPFFASSTAYEKRLDLNKTKWLKYSGAGIAPEVVRTGIAFPTSSGTGDYSLVFYTNDGAEAFASCTESGLYPIPPTYENIITPTYKAPTLVATPFGSRVVAGGTSLLYNTPNGGKISIYTIKGELVSRMVVVDNRTVVKVPAAKGMYIVKLEAK